MWRWFYRVFVGYGYQPQRGFGGAAGLLLLGMVIFLVGYRAGVIVPADPEVVQHYGWIHCQEAVGRTPAECWKASEEGRDHTRFFALVYSFDTLVPLIDLGQERAWSPNVDEKRPFGWVAQGYLWFHTLLGWVLASLLAATLTGVIKRDV